MRKCLAIILVTLFCGLVALVAGRADAAVVPLNIEPTLAINAGNLEVTFKVTNQGEVPATDVEASLQFESQSALLVLSSKLEPQQSASEHHTFAMLPTDRGDYPLYAVLRHTDPDGVRHTEPLVLKVRTPDATDSGLQLAMTFGNGQQWHDLRVDMNFPGITSGSVQVTCHAPDELIAVPMTQPGSLAAGKGSVRFELQNKSAVLGSTYQVFVLVEYDQPDGHHMVWSAASVEVPEAPPPLPRSEQDWRVLGNKIVVLSSVIAGALILALITLAFSRRRVRNWMVRAFASGASGQPILTVIAIVAIEIFLFVQLAPEYLFTSTITTGGDTGSHYYTLEYLRTYLLPHGQIGGWTPGNYGGFPILQMYFPLPFLAMCLMDLVVPLQIAFKLGTILGTLLMPIAAYLMLRQFRCPWPGPAIGSVFSALFLCNHGNSAWGGNICSTLAGEFSYSLSMALSLVLLGSLFRGCVDNRHVIRNAFLVFLVGFSHGYTLLFVEAVSVFFLLTPYGFVRRAVYLGKVYALGFLFLAFWLVPLLVFSKYTTPYHYVWDIGRTEFILPLLLKPIVAIAIAGSIALIVWLFSRGRGPASERLLPVAYLWFGTAVASAMYILAPRLGLVDIRYLPYVQLLLCLTAAYTLGWLLSLLRPFGLDWLALVTVVLGGILWTCASYTYLTSDLEGRFAPGWSRWNYSGFETKPGWNTLQEISAELRGTFQDPRVVFEHSGEHDLLFGTSRVFESLPLFAGRATMEGLYMQASITAPYAFYIQSLVGDDKSCPFPQYSYTYLDYPRARQKLGIFNVGELILRSEHARQAIRLCPDYQLLRTMKYQDKNRTDIYEIWRLKTDTRRYVEPLAYEPVLFETKDWKRTAFQWFRRDDLDDIFLVFGPNLNTAEREHFKLRAQSLDGLPRVPIDVGSCRVKEEVTNQEIRIHTNWIGKPLLVKMSYHPDWHVEGADRIYLVSPSLMLVYPTREDVRLYFARGKPDRVGYALTALGLLALLMNLRIFGRGKPTVWVRISRRIGVPESLEPRIPWNSGRGTRWALFAVVFALGISGAVAACCYVYTHQPQRHFNKAVEMENSRPLQESDAAKAARLAAARALFQGVVRDMPDSWLAQQSAIRVAYSYYNEDGFEAALKEFRDFAAAYPDSDEMPAVDYHIGQCLFRLDREKEAIAQMRMTASKYACDSYARSAENALRDHNALEAPPQKPEPVEATSTTGS